MPLRAVRLEGWAVIYVLPAENKKLLHALRTPIISPDIIQFALCLLYIQLDFGGMCVINRQLVKQDMHHPSAGKPGNKRISSPERQLSKG